VDAVEAGGVAKLAVGGRSYQHRSETAASPTPSLGAIAAAAAAATTVSLPM